MEMKKIYKTLMTLAAAILLAPAAFAQSTLPVQYQHEKYLKNDKKTIGYNKYLVSDQPDANGEYTLRIENFVTGKIDTHALPTDFVLVLDNSGSMLYDYRTVSQSDMPQFVSKADNDVSHYIVKDDGFSNFTRCAYSAIYTGGSYGQNGSGTKLWENAFGNQATSGIGTFDVSRYYYYEDTAKPTNTGYYYIYHRNIGGIRNLCFTLQDGNEKYLYGTTWHDSPNTDTNINADAKIIYTGEIWRPIQRREKLFEAVEAFAAQIKAENDKDQWAAGVTKHQLAIVSFGNGYEGSSAANAMNARGQYDETFSGNTKVIKRFSEVTNAADYPEAMRKTMSFRGSTYVDLGMTLGRMLFENLQGQDGMGPVTNKGGKNRNKVLILLTDGQPSEHNTASGWKQQYGVIKESLKEGVKVKTLRAADPHIPSAAVAANGICGSVFTIDLYNIDKSKAFLDHLSSNYPQSDQSNTSGSWGTSGYSGTRLTPETSCIYYNDGSSTDLTEIFKQIGEASTGETGQMVAVDAMSDDFVIPFTTTDVNKVKIYTAECIGKKMIDGEEYLAFAREVEAPTREAIAHLWVPRLQNNVIEWVDLGDPYPQDIDGVSTSRTITFSVSSDSKKIIVKGFNYSELFCGEDPSEEHTTGTSANTRQMAADDPNAEFALPGYRGFKLIFEFPIVLDPDALGGVNVPTNNIDESGLYLSDANGNPIGNGEVHYPTPDLPVPVRLVIQKLGLKTGESANFTIQRRERAQGSTWTDFTTFVLTGEANSTPEVRIINLDPAYYYKVKEENWSWAYTNVHPEYTTEPDTDGKTISNPIVFENNPIPDTPSHAEAKATNKMTTWVNETSSAEFSHSK